MIKRLSRLIRMALVGAALVGSLAATAGMATTAQAAAVKPAGVQDCNSNTVNWVALYPTYDDWLAGQGATKCIGDKGTWDVPSNTTDVFCAGNNSGTVTFYDRTTGATYTKSFSSDRSYSVVAGVWQGASAFADSLDIMTVKITGWTGSAGC